jgi:RNA polymerase sigma-70 factor (ECF subfamily)
MVGGDDDADLVGRCMQGHVEAFEPLVARYERVVFNLALRMVGDREDARDLAQNTFLKAYEKLGTYDPRHRFFSWIYRIAVNECLNFVSRRRPAQELDPGLASGDDPHEQAEAGELDVRIQQGLAKLPPDLRLALVLRHFLELSYAEMSGVLRIPEKTVKSRLHEARIRLGDILRRSLAP